MKYSFTRMALLLLITLGSWSMAQAQFTATGQVTDANNEPLIGVSILVKGTTRGTVTDFDGNFSIEVPNDEGVLVFSYTGFGSEERQVSASNNTVNVTMDEDVADLEEVVVTGLASSVKRANLANAVSTVKGSELTGVTTQSTVDGALYGKLTGVNIVQTSGAPGGGIAIRLRGVSSLSGNNQPLIIIDGVYMSNIEIPSGLRFASGANSGSEENASNRLADLNPADIESIEVLKGASAAAIYGTRANAGVVVITTKRGSAGRTNISLNQDFGFNSIIKKVGRRQYTAQEVEDAFGPDERTKFEAALAAGEVFDYEDEIYGNLGFISDTRLQVNGGNNKTQFYVAGGYRSDDGIIEGTGYDRLTIRANLDHKISNKVDFSLNTNYINSVARRGFTGNENEGGLSYGYNLAFTRDWVNLFPDDDGNYPDNPNASGNPIFVRDQTENVERVNRLIQGAALDIKLLQSDRQVLRLDLRGGIDFFMNETKVYVPETHQAQRGQDNGFIGVGKNKVFNYNTNAFLVHNIFTGSGLSFNTSAGISYLNFDRDFVLTRTTQLVPLQDNLTQGGAQQITQTIEKEEEFGIVAQETVNWDDKIIGTIGVRFDKSSLNGDPNKYFFFPRASLAINISNFDFWTLGVMNQLKLRAAYGQTGNSASFGSLFTALVPTNIGGNTGFVVDLDQGNDMLEPETSSEFELGTDMGFFNSRLTFSFTYYNRAVNDLLYQRSIPASSGFSSEIRNDLDLTNRGMEVSIGITPFSSPAVTWNTTFNWWYNRSEITRLGVENTTDNPADNPEDIPSFTPPGVAFGLGLGTFYINEGSPITALWQSGSMGPEIVGDVEPDFQLSWFNQFTFIRNLQFNFLLHWKQGGDVLNLTRLLTDIGGTTPKDLDDLEGFIEDGTYLRLREIGAYYTFNLNSNFLRAIRLGASARNLITITNYSSYDPETSTKGGTGLSNSIEVTPFPSSKQVYFHLGFDF